MKSDLDKPTTVETPLENYGLENSKAETSHNRMWQRVKTQNSEIISTFSGLRP